MKGRKRQVMVDTDGRGLVLDPHPAEASPPCFAGRGPKPPPPADVQDRDGAVPVLRRSRRSYPFITKAFADAGGVRQGPRRACAVGCRTKGTPAIGP